MMHTNYYIICNHLMQDPTISQASCADCVKSSCGCSPSMIVPPTDSLLSNNQKKIKSQSILKVKELIGKSEVALVLGAGVSIPAKMPNWSTLVSKMMGYSLRYGVETAYQCTGRLSDDDKRIIKLCDEMIEGNLVFLSNMDVLESGQYIAQQFDDPTVSEPWRLQELSMKIMVERMLRTAKHPVQMLIDACNAEAFGEKSDALIEKWRSQLNDEWSVDVLPTTKDLYDDIVSNFKISRNEIEKVISEQNTITAVAYLLSRKNGIKKAMTYNYDPLVELYSKVLFDSKVIAYNGNDNHKSYSLKDGECNLFHLHGFVPGHFASIKTLDLPKPSERLILSEDSYYAIEKNGLYDFSSRIQVNFLEEKKCLFVGFSATDYNFKRILRQIGFRKGEPCHYLIYTIDDVAKYTYQDVCRYHLKSNEPFDVDAVRKDSALLLARILDNKKAYWNRFQIEPIWTTIADLPQLLVELGS